ncbi:thiamine pyrophosphate-dependent dehydrogenase E1 component subunit alpha [Alkalihalobacterium alkalinitrilicum]|uniref:thiamine pyrophosphate-dependent dehydrogenase E1 component subunit alpha n=1 Tax=Alkalihalobacterium alkalinitrilicum TaxID=427920 RepID=UPI000995C7D6|nr:thiamine pyrophosphate-dependent dehydrogenase E1 component subunit alpha [Alkalihalobacterium alkalinitrilicum]
MTISNEQKVELLKQILTAREFEERLSKLFAENKLAGWVHLCKGQETMGAALSLFMKSEDFLVPYHRSRSSLLGKGLEPKILLSEIMGKKTGCCNGIGGEAHIMDAKSGIYGTGGIIGSSIPISVGIAYANQLEGNNSIVISGFGEGGSNRGAFHEALNMAATWNLGIVFICENNQYAEFSPLDVQMKIENLADRAIGYGMPGEIVDGYNPIECAEIVEKAIQRARNGGGPTLIEVKTYRLHGHYEGDPMNYRTKEEYEHWARRDPVITFRQELLGANVINEDELDQFEKDMNEWLDEAVHFALDSPYPDEEDARKFVYA